MEKKENIIHIPTGIIIKDPIHTIIFYQSETINDIICKYWRLKEKLSKRNRTFNNILKCIVLSIFFILSFILLYFITLLVSMFLPGLEAVFGIVYGIFVFIGFSFLSITIEGLNIFINYYYKHRKFH